MRALLLLALAVSARAQAPALPPLSAFQEEARALKIAPERGVPAEPELYAVAVGDVRTYRFSVFMDGVWQAMNFDFKIAGRKQVEINGSTVTAFVQVMEGVPGESYVVVDEERVSWYDSKGRERWPQWSFPRRKPAGKSVRLAVPSSPGETGEFSVSRTDLDVPYGRLRGLRLYLEKASNAKKLEIVMVPKVGPARISGDLAWGGGPPVRTKLELVSFTPGGK